MGRRGGTSQAGNVAASRGGRANEAGSLYRSGIAAYLAAHGLAGRGLEAAGYPEDGPSPVTLAFETGDSVDDISCGLTDGTTLRLQAKRACGADAQLTATVIQWAGQVSHLQPGDRVGLATAEPRGPVRNLGAALDRHRRPVPGPYTSDERRALGAVRERILEGTAEGTIERILDAAIVMTVAASAPSDEGFRSVANLLDGVVVPTGCGSAAISALQHAFQQQATTGTGSDLDEWLRILEAAGLQVIPEADGAAGQRRRAELDAIAAHRARLAARNGILEFSLLADDLPPMVYRPLADTFRVSVEGGDHGGEGFLVTARRWPRMLLAGLPGMGKTTALGQAAARWAKDPRAPIPVRVPLRELTRRRPRSAEEITLAVLIEVATEAAPQQERLVLRRALERAVTAGEAILLLDGLDECQDRRAVVADGVASVLGELPANAGVVLASRGSGLAAARRLALPEAQLIEPYRLEDTLEALVRHAAASRPIPEAGRDQWVRERVQRLDDIRRSHYDLWRVPLLATLLTLLVIKHETGTLPASRARLLADAVDDTVRQWELARLWETRPYPRLDPGQLLDGYGEIAHAVTGGANGCSAASTRDAVAAMLAARWGLAPAAAEAQADSIMWFWDEHVGVFVAAPVTGEIEPRSRVFAETGDAMWAARQPTATRREWIVAALGDDDRREPVMLAVGLSPQVASEVIDVSTHTTDEAARSRGLLWAADAIADGATAPAIAVSPLLGALAQATRDSSSAEAPGDTPAHRPAATPARWAYILRMAITPAPSSLRTVRNDLLAELARGGYEQVLAAALAALADARADSRDVLEREQVASVSRLLTMDLPREPPVSEPAAQLEAPVVLTASEDELLPGHHEAAEQAIRYLPQLGSEAVVAIYRIARRGTAGEYKRVRDRMTALGHPDPEPLRVRLKVPEVFERFDHMWDGWKVFLDAAASLAAHQPLTTAENWRYPSLATLDDVLDTGQATLDGINHAFTTDKALLPEWITAVAHAAGLDLTAIATEASAAMQAWSGGDKEMIEVIFAPPPSLRPELEPSRLDGSDIVVLINALGATSDWIAHTAYRILLNSRDPGVGQRILELIPGLPVSRRYKAAILAVTNDPNPPVAAARILDSDDPATRAGGAAAARMCASAGDAIPWTSVLDRAQADSDMTIRSAAGLDRAAAQTATCWTCLKCGTANETTVRWCASCSKPPYASKYPDIMTAAL